MSDEYVTGLRDGTMTIAGMWNPSDMLFAPSGIGERRQARHVLSLRKLFGVEWWSERIDYELCITGWEPDTGEMMFSVTSPVTTVRAEWWRRFGHAIVKHLPMWER